MLVVRGALGRHFADLFPPLSSLNSGISEILCRKAHYSRNTNRRGQREREPAKTLLPVAIRHSNKSLRPGGVNDNEDVDIDKLKSDFRRDVRQEFRRCGDVGDNLEEVLDRGYEEARWEHARRANIVNRSKMRRKHFQGLFEKEVNLLTYAEKEKIKYLYKSNPEEYNPEAIAESFPVSPEGAYKIIQSTFKARTIKEIKQHDEHVAATIKRIETGEIASTPELKVRMEMRSKTPIQVGVFDPYDKRMLLTLPTPKVVGEFQRLVGPPVSSKRSNNNQNLPFLLGDDPTAPRKTTFANTEEPDLGDYYIAASDMKVTKELKKVKALHEPMTYTEFITQLQKTKRSVNPEIMHLKNASPENANEKVIPVSPAEIDTEEEKVNPMQIQRFKNSRRGGTESGTERDNVRSQDKSRKNIWNTQNEQEHYDRIDIPEHLKGQGSQFRKGKSFYDENGSFLYRVI